MTRVNLQGYVSVSHGTLNIGEASSYYLFVSRLNLIQRTLEASIKENILTEACSCSSKTNEKQINRKTHLRVISDLSKRSFQNSNELVTTRDYQGKRVNYPYWSSY